MFLPLPHPFNRRNRESDNNHEEGEERLEESKGRSLPPQLIDARIAALGDWRGETLARVRALIKRADPDVVEERRETGLVISALARPGRKSSYASMRIF